MPTARSRCPRSRERLPTFEVGELSSYHLDIRLEREAAQDPRAGDAIHPKHARLFRSPDGSGAGPTLRERIRWQAENLGYATSAEPGNAFGLLESLFLVTVAPDGSGTLFTWEERYESADLPSARAGFDDGIADIAERLVARFGGRVIERYMDAPR